MLVALLVFILLHVGEKSCTTTSFDDNMIELVSRESRQTICPAGYTLNYAGTACRACPPGHYTDGPGYKCGSSYDQPFCGCKACLSGYVCANNGTTTPVMCQAGTVADFTRTRCRACPPGFFTDAPGYQCMSAYNEPECGCKVCRSGHICAVEGTIDPVICPAGTVANFNNTLCQKCPPGYYTNGPGYQCWNSYKQTFCGCRVCLDGHICAEHGTVEPVMCPAGTAAEFTKTKCRTCPAGYYMNAAGSQCKSSYNQEFCGCNPCPSGQVC